MYLPPLHPPSTPPRSLHIFFVSHFSPVRDLFTTTANFTLKMDRGTVSTLHVFPQEETEETNLQVQKQLEIFILEFRLDNVFVYRYDASASGLARGTSLMSEMTETNCARTRFYKDFTATSTLAT